MQGEATQPWRMRGHGSMVAAAAAVLTFVAVPAAWAQPDDSAARARGAESAVAAPASSAGKPSDTSLVVRVRDRDGKPVRGASVWVRSGESWIEGQSDRSGNADFDGLKTGSTRVQVVATGWNSSGSSVDLDGGEVTLDVALERRAAPSRPAAANGSDPRRPPATPEHATDGEH